MMRTSTRRRFAVVLTVVALLGSPLAARANDEVSLAPQIAAAQGEVYRLRVQANRVAEQLADTVRELHHVETELQTLADEITATLRRIMLIDRDVHGLEMHLPVIVAAAEHYQEVLSTRAVEVYIHHSNIDAKLAFEVLESPDLVAAARSTRLANHAQEIEIDSLADAERVHAATVAARDAALVTRAETEAVLSDLTALHRAYEVRKEALLLRIAELRDQQAQLDVETAAAAQRVRDLEQQEAERLYRIELERRAQEDANGDGVPDASGPPPPPPQAEPQRPVAEGDAANQVPLGDVICPIDAPVQFGNDWGEPRSGWRFHAGTDIFAGGGTPNVAVADGVARQSLSPKGGNGVWLEADHGVHYYYAHLSGWAGEWPGGSRRVVKGEVVGFTGNTGNASGGPIHTHFQIHPGGGGPVNPYSVLLAVCD